MGVLERLKSALDGGEERQYGYVCGDCQARFESTEHNPNFTDCPSCGSSRVHTTV